MDIHEFQENGWTQIALPSSYSLLDLAKQFGTAVPPRPDRPLLRVLKPVDKPDAVKGSLSALRGRDAFPFHTDCAYFRQPPTLILFRATRPTNVATLLLDGRKILRSIEVEVRQAIFKVRGLRKYFYCRPFSNERIRWDVDCMVPAEKTAELVTISVIEQCQLAESFRFQWKDSDTVLVVDNTRVLHGRENAASDYQRELESVLVYSNLIGSTNVGS